MLATIIIDSFAPGEAAHIADALDMLCAPDDTYGFASVGIYSFWSIPERDILYIGLAGELRQRFRQHTGMISCDPDCCKRREIEAYFRDRPRLGYSVMVQSPMDQPPSADDLEALADMYDDAFDADATDLFGGGENAAVAEGMLLDLHEKLGGRIPPWNKQHGVQRGRGRRSLSTVRDRIRTAEAFARTGKAPEDHASEPPYELLLNLTGYELSDLNAKSSLREIAANTAICEHEEFLHGVRMLMVSRGCTFNDAVGLQRRFNEFARQQLEMMQADGYLGRVPVVPGIPRAAS